MTFLLAMFNHGAFSFPKITFVPDINKNATFRWHALQYRLIIQLHLLVEFLHLARE